MIDEKTLDALKAKHVRVKVCETAAGTIVLRGPSRQEWRLFKSMVNDEAALMSANENFITTLCVYPSREEFSKLLDVFPGIELDKNVQKAIKILTGQEQDAEGKG